MIALEDNVAALLLANELMDLGFTLVKESGIPAESVRRFWQYVMESAGELVGDEVVEKPKQPKIMSYVDARRFGRGLMPFGQHKDTCIDEVPIDYLEWLLDQQGTFIADLERYMASTRIMSERR